jgi:hypothetical protein
MAPATTGISPITASRTAGALYLLTMATAVISEMAVKSKLIVDGDAAATAANLIAAKPLFRFAIACDVITSAGVVALVWSLHLLLHPVNRDLARLAAVFRVVETAVGFVVILANFGALRLLSTSPYLGAIPAEQLHALALAVLNYRAVSLNIVFLLLGLGSAFFAILWVKSGAIPRWLAFFGVAGSVLLAAYSFLLILYPPAASLGILPMLPLGVFEVTLGFWLFFAATRTGTRLASLHPASP